MGDLKMKKIVKIGIPNRKKFIKGIDRDWKFTDEDLSLLSENEQLVLAKMLSKMYMQRMNCHLEKHVKDAPKIIKQIQSNPLFKAQLF